MHAVKKLLIMGFLCSLILYSGRAVSEMPKGEKNGQFTYDDDGLRDPFVPLLARKGQTDGLMSVRKEDDIFLEGIIWDPEGTSFVVINGEVLRRGQEAYLVRIEDISETQARISINENAYIYTLDKNVK